MLRSIVGVFAGIAIFAAAGNAEAVVLKIGTVAPPGSPWATQFDKMASDVKKATNGEVEIQFVYSQPDEPTIVSKAGGGAELQGGAVTAAGLAKIYPDVLAFQMPGLWGEDIKTGWAKLEYARTKMRPQLDTAFASAGFTILGWGDVGVARIMGRKPVVTPDNLRGLSTFTLNGDTIGPVFAPQLGLSAKNGISIGEVTANVGSFDVFEAPPLAAVSLGWSNSVTHVNTMPVSYLIGAVVMNTKAYEGLSEDAKKLLREGGDKAGKSLTGRIRSADEKAWGIMKTKCGESGVHDPSEPEKNQWREKFASIRSQLRGSAFSAAFFDKLIGLSK